MTSRFWYLDSPRLHGGAEASLDIEFEKIICPIHGPDHNRGGKRLTDLSVRVDPSHIRDINWVWGDGALISQRILKLFERHRVTGFEVRPAKVSYSKAAKARPPDLFELVVTGWGGFAAPAAGVSLVESCPGCGYRSYAIAEPSRLIDAVAWDGSDLFIVWPLPGYYFASDRLANILQQERVSGVKTFPATALPMERGDGATPGPLAWSMPEHRTRELEQRYGTVIS